MLANIQYSKFVSALETLKILLPFLKIIREFISVTNKFQRDFHSNFTYRRIFLIR